jgi:putative hemolysin
LLGFLILLNAFFAASEIAIISVRKPRLRQLVEDKVRGAKVVERLAEGSSRFLATIQIGVTLAGFLASATAAVNLSDGLGALIGRAPWPLLAQHSKALSVSIITLVLAFLVLVFGELVPKTVALRYAEPIALRVAPVIDLLATIAAPAVRVLSWSTNLVAGLLGARPEGRMPFVTEEEIKSLVDAGEEEGILEQDEKEMIYSIFELGDTLAREVMVPRLDMGAVEVGMPLKEALKVVIQAGHSRIPVYEESIDNILGILYAKDLLPVLLEGKIDTPLREMLRPAVFVPETNRVDELLEELQRKRVHIAIVVDEYGGTAGLVTIEDILEEIVGEIQDEYDREEPTFQVISEEEVVFKGQVVLDEVNQIMDIELPTEEADTLGGLIYSRLGRVPSPGDELLLDGVKLAVLSVAGRRIQKVKVTKEKGDAAA